MVRFQCVQMIAKVSLNSISHVVVGNIHQDLVPELESSPKNRKRKNVRRNSFN